MREQVRSDECETEESQSSEWFGFFPIPVRCVFLSSEMLQLIVYRSGEKVVWHPEAQTASMTSFV